VAALSDNPAWREFFERYRGFVRDRCSVYGLDAASVDELCQRVWVELARRMPSYQYDPGGSFRGWLRRLCHHRAIDLLRERQSGYFEALDCDKLIDKTWSSGDFDREIDDGETDSAQLLRREALAVQEEVRRKVKPSRWEAFWRVVVEGQSVKEAATALGLKYATVYAGVNHVAELLCAEGRRRKAHIGLGVCLFNASLTNLV
jgi:RNA polymerase sigma factor (sigma-70 family)